MKNTHKDIYQTLVERRNEILDSIGNDSSALNQLRQDQTGDIVDFASGSAFGEMSSQLAEVEIRELKNIQAAMKRIQDQTYGVCEGCEKSIPSDRLSAIPHTMHCIVCQRAAEEEDLDPSKITDWTSILGDSSSALETGTSSYGVNLP